MTVDSAHAAAPRIPLVDLHKQAALLGDRIRAGIDTVLAHGDFVNGQEVHELEAKLAACSGATAAVTVANGTEALLIVLLAKNIGPGDAVFVPAFTFAATAGAVVLSGATPVFVDVDDDTLTMDTEHLRSQVASVRGAGLLRPRAVIPVDLFGRPADYPGIMALAEIEGLFVLADAAQSFGAVQGDKAVGTLAPASAVSFYPSKPLGCFGDAGAVLTGDTALADAVRGLRNHGMDSSGEVRQAGLNSRMDSLQAAVLLAKLEAFEDELGARRQAAAWYRQRLSPVLRTPPVPHDGRSAWAVYAVRSPHREALRRALSAERIASAVYYRKPLHLQPAYAVYGSGPGSLPVSERVSGEILALPMHGYLDEDTVAEVCSVLLHAMDTV